MPRNQNSTFRNDVTSNFGKGYSRDYENYNDADDRRRAQENFGRDEYGVARNDEGEVRPGRQTGSRRQDYDDRDYNAGYRSGGTYDQDDYDSNYGASRDYDNRGFGKRGLSQDDYGRSSAPGFQDEYNRYGGEYQRDDGRRGISDYGRGSFPSQHRDDERYNDSDYARRSRAHNRASQPQPYERDADRSRGRFSRNRGY